jgi:hypothetical protein
MFLLVHNGFAQPGKRPPCSLAFYTGVKLQIWNGREWRDSSKKFGDVTVYARWEREPTLRQIRLAKQRLSPLPSGKEGL